MQYLSKDSLSIPTNNTKIPTHLMQMSIYINKLKQNNKKKKLHVRFNSWKKHIESHENKNTYVP